MLYFESEGYCAFRILLTVLTRDSYHQIFVSSQVDLLKIHQHGSLVKSNCLARLFLYSLYNDSGHDVIEEMKILKLY